MRKGDIVRVVRISEGDKSFTDADEMRTHELFRFCFGRTFRVRGFDEYGFVELDPSDDPDVRKEFGPHHTIWIEPEFLKIEKGPIVDATGPSVCERCGHQIVAAEFVRCETCWWPFKDKRLPSEKPKTDN